MKKQNLFIGLELIEKKPSKHTQKLHVIIIKGIYEGFDYCKNRRYTYVIAQTKDGQFYPAANKSNLNSYPLFLDGLMGDYRLATLKANYKINN